MAVKQWHEMTEAERDHYAITHRPGANPDDGLTREDFPPRQPGQLGWVLHSGDTTVRVADMPDTDWPGTLDFLAKYGKQWEFCTHEPHC